MHDGGGWHARGYPVKYQKRIRPKWAQFPVREEAATDGTDLADAALERFVFLCTGHVPRFLAATDPRPMFRKPY